MATTFDFNTGQLYLSAGQPSNLKVKGTITRISKTKVKITAKVYSQYRMNITAIYFHFAYGTTYKAFSKDYPGIGNGYKEITSSKGIQTDIVTSGGSWLKICTDKEFTVPEGELYFATWFHAPSYYHVNSGTQKYNVIAGKTIKTKLSKYFTEPSALALTVSSRTSSSITVKASWTAGTEPKNESAKVTIDGTTKTITTNGGTATFSGLTGNKKYSIGGTLYHNTKSYDTDSTSATTYLEVPNNITCTHNTTSLVVKATSDNGTGNSLQYQYRYKLNSSSTYSSWSSKIDYDKSYTINNLTPNRLYSVQVRAVRSIEPTTSSEYTKTFWTRPKATLSLTRPKGSEHNSIKATAGSEGSTSYIEYRFKIDSNNFVLSENPKTFKNLEGHSTHTITVKIKNTKSGLESAEVSKSLTTWYNPITNLSVNLVNRWYWYLSINALFRYQGGVSNIKKYEFGINSISSGSNYDSKADTSVNSYSKGTVIAGDPNNLKYNTNYNCIVRITDNHERQYTANAVFKTLDERPLYLNGELSEVKIIKPDNTVEYLTPNILNTIHTSNDGTEKVINMNKIINNDNRTEFE